ncbi:hypothetical protein HLBS07_13820 [Vibrio alginolyticus]|nr:hypothetical protein HLBS07_13820 [Vibrio alginolyticus]
MFCSKDYQYIVTARNLMQNVSRKDILIARVDGSKVFTNAINTLSLTLKVSSTSHPYSANSMKYVQ